MNRLKQAEGEPRQRRVAFGQRGAGNRRQRACQHRGAADPARRQRRRARDRLDEHAFESSLPQLAEQQPDQEHLLVRRRAAEQVAQLLRFVGRGSASGRDGDAAEGRVDLCEIQRRAGRGDVVDRAASTSGPGDANAPLQRRPAQERDADHDVVRRKALEQGGQSLDLLEPPACFGDRLGGRHQFDQAHTKLGVGN